MSRLSLLAAAVLSLTAAASTHAVIVFHPAPVPTPDCKFACDNLAPYYQRQLYVLNRPYGSINFSSDPCSRPTVDLLLRPCPAPEPLYFRKSALMPSAESAPAVDPSAKAKGTVIIIPKALLNRPLKSFEPKSEPLARRD